MNESTQTAGSIRWLPMLAIFLAAAPRLPSTPTFELLGDLPGGSNFSEALGISADGDYVVGHSSSTGSFHTIAILSRLEAFVWDSISGIVGLGDLPGGGTQFSSAAFDVSADGIVVCGRGRVDQTQPGQLADSNAPFIWRRGLGMARLNIAFNSGNLQAAAVAVSDCGEFWTGRATWTDLTTGEFFDRGFWRTPRFGVVHFNPFPEFNGAAACRGGAISPDGGVIVGSFSPTGSSPANAFRLRGSNSDGFFAQVEDLGQINGAVTHATCVSADGRTIAGTFSRSGSPDGAFLFREGASPPLVQLRADGAGATGISGNGRVILDAAGGLYLDGQGPFDLREILAEAEVIDLRGLSASQFRANALSTTGMVVAGRALVGGVTQAWRVRLTDCDQSGVADVLERRVLITQGTQDFYTRRETLGEGTTGSPYGTMIARYGKPWRPGTGRVPRGDGTDPAELLRAALALSDCEVSFLNSEAAADRFLANAGFPVLRELHSFEMLLGNEAFSDALDPTIGLDGISPDDLSGEFAFKGAPGITDLLDEELALLRGRELPGSPADWVNETIYYPEFSGRTVAVYNRLPPNAGPTTVAYKSNYRVADNFEAASKFPQGHGDAYGYHLTALKAGIGFLRDGPNDWPEEFLGRIAALAAGTDAGLEAVRHIAEAGAARAQSAHAVTELLYRRDYREDPQDPRAAQLFIDPDRERAWSMGEWARRGAAGAYLDWALVAHWSPTDEARPVRRGSLGELDELASAVSGLQERLDTAGAGLDPLGLLPNVVPFGIDAAGLDSFCRMGAQCSGSSHYQQVSAAARQALDNARLAFEAANQAGQRLRDSDRSFSDFAERIEDTQVDFNQQLIEIFGLPSPDDLRDNDLDPATNDFQESQSAPDLANFLATDDLLASQRMRPRPAPGQVQLAISELRVAALGLEKAELEIDNHAASIRSQMDRIQIVSKVQIERVQIVAEACQEQVSLIFEQAILEERKKVAGMLLSGLTNPQAALQNLALDIAGQIIQFGLNELVPSGTDFDEQFQIDAERVRVQCRKEARLQGLEDFLEIDAERRRLEALVRQTPLFIVARHEALERATQALGRLNQAVARGRRLLKERQRLLSRTEGDLLEERWRDMSFRVFRNAALKNYRAFFDLGARYVVLSARAYAYEFSRPSSSNQVLAGIYRQRRLGRSGSLVGLQGVLTRLDGAAVAGNFNRPLELLGDGRGFSFKQNLLGAGFEAGSDLRFRAWLESQIVERLEILAEVRELARIVPDRDFGPAIVISFSSEIDGDRNFFGRGPDPPFGNSNFSPTRNVKIRSYAIRFDGVDTQALGIDPNSGSVFVFLLPVGESVMREDTNEPVLTGLPVPWAVVDQFLPVPPIAEDDDLARRSFNPWSSTAQVQGNYLNAVKRHRDSEAQVDLGQPLRFNTNLAGRSAWNTRWLLIIPGGAWTASSNPAEIRRKLLQFIYGSTADPAANRGIFDIRLIIQGYSH